MAKESGLEPVIRTADDRAAFERWVKSDYPHWWPNPGTNGSRWHEGVGHGVGFYVNKQLNAMWLAWQEGKKPLLRHIETLGHVIVPAIAVCYEEAHAERIIEALNSGSHETRAKLGATRVPLVIQGEPTLLHGVLPPGLSEKDGSCPRCDAARKSHGVVTDSLLSEQGKQPTPTSDERLKRLQRMNDRVRAASERLNEANDELAAAEIEWRLANEALEESE